MESLFKENSQYIKLYFGTEVVQDHFEKNTETRYLYSVPIKAIVSDLSFGSMQYKMPGILTDRAKELLIEKSKLSLLALSQYIEVDGVKYEGFKVHGRLQLKEVGNYLRIYIYDKAVK